MARVSGCCSAVQSGPTPHADPTDRSAPVFSVPHCLPGFSDPRPSSQRRHPTTSPLPSPLLLPSVFPSIRLSSSESPLHIRRPKRSTAASASVLPMDSQGGSPLLLTGWISLQSKGRSRVCSNTTVRKRQFFLARPSLWSVGAFIKSLDSLEKYIYY